MKYLKLAALFLLMLDVASVILFFVMFIATVAVYGTCVEMPFLGSWCIGIVVVTVIDAVLFSLIKEPFLHFIIKTFFH